MGFGYPRTSVAMLDASTDRDRGFNSSALSIADSLGAALALSVSGVVFAAAARGGADPFLSVFAVASPSAVVGVGHRRAAPPARQSRSGSVFSRTSSSVTPGRELDQLEARSPSVPEAATSPVAGSTTSMTPRSVMIRCTTRLPV